MSAQLSKLDALISAACAAREVARNNRLFASCEGVVLCDAIFDLTECSDVFDLALDVRREAGLLDEWHREAAA